jgi:hypothetical protein
LEQSLAATRNRDAGNKWCFISMQDEIKDGQAKTSA